MRILCMRLCRHASTTHASTCIATCAVDWAMWAWKCMPHPELKSLQAMLHGCWLIRTRSLASPTHA